MEPAALTGLLPLGGASVLLIYMLRIWLAERKLWMREREQMLVEHQTALERQQADYVRHIEYLRNRVLELEQQQTNYVRDIEYLRARVRELEQQQAKRRGGTA